jgi:aspartyl-tRNA(Asn)/glutamyl-tRNA(Gln) amidotransferase subunit C
MRNGPAATELTLAEVEHVAMLARLALTPDEMDRMRREMASILAQVAALDEVDTSRIAPSATVLALDTVLQDDVSRACLTPEQVIANAPAAEENQFRVPAILEE